MLRITSSGFRAIQPGGIIFDMDGVLMNSSSIHADAYREALVGIPIGDFDYSRLAGLRTIDAIRVLLNGTAISLSEDQLEALAASKSRIALERIVAENPIVPGALGILQALFQAHRLALGTSASVASVNAFLDRNAIRPLFRCVVHSGDVRRAKPAPDIFAAAARGMNLAPEQCLVVEDARVGIQAAKAAGAVACGIPSTCSANELEQAGADCVIDQLEDLLEIGAWR